MVEDNEEIVAKDDDGCCDVEPIADVEVLVSFQVEEVGKEETSGELLKLVPKITPPAANIFEFKSFFRFIWNRYLHTIDTMEETETKSTKLFVTVEILADDSLQQKNMVSNIRFIPVLLQNPKL